MKSILMGGASVPFVYPAERLAVLQKEAGLLPGVLTKEQILENPAMTADAVCIFSTWGMPKFTEEEIRLCFPKLKAIFYAAGTVQAFAREFLNCGVQIFSAWAANAVPVAEYTVAQIILANKGFFQACRREKDLESRRGAKLYHGSFPGNYGCKVGLIGAGMIGKLVLEMLKPYRLDVYISSTSMTEEQAAIYGAKKATTREIFANCQTISNHVADLPATKGMFGKELFSLMKPNATFINTGRGAQVVEEDLIAVLKENPDMTAILDVTFPEPPVAESDLYTLPNVFLTPHIAGSSGDERQRMSAYMEEEFYRWRAGQPCKWEVTEKMLETMA